MVYFDENLNNQIQGSNSPNVFFFIFSFIDKQFFLFEIGILFQTFSKLLREKNLQVELSQGIITNIYKFLG